MSEEIEALESALMAVQKKYGYAYLDVSIHDSAFRHNEFYATINYPDGRYSFDAKGATLRDALSRASANAINAPKEAAE